MNLFGVQYFKDLAPHGIRVNAISPALIGPGFMWTRQNELHAASGSPYFASNADDVAKGKIAGYVSFDSRCIDSVHKLTLDRTECQ